MAKGLTTLSVDKVTKQKAERMAKKLHLTLSGVTRILLNDFGDGKIQITTVMISKDENGFTEEDKAELNTVLEDVDQGKNLEGSFNSAQEFIRSLKASFIENKIINTKITQRRSGK